MLAIIVVIPALVLTSKAILDYVKLMNELAMLFNVLYTAIMNYAMTLDLVGFSIQA